MAIPKWGLTRTSHRLILTYDGEEVAYVPITLDSQYNWFWDDAYRYVLDDGAKAELTLATGYAKPRWEHHVDKDMTRPEAILTMYALGAKLGASEVSDALT